MFHISHYTPLFLLLYSLFLLGASTDEHKHQHHTNNNNNSRTHVESVGVQSGEDVQGDGFEFEDLECGKESKEE